MTREVRRPRLVSALAAVASANTSALRAPLRIGLLAARVRLGALARPGVR